MIGLSQSKREVSPANPPLSQPRFPPAACHFRSLPAQNALSPAPVTIATHCSGSAQKSSNTLSSSKCASVCSALYTSGRDSVTMVTGPLRVTLPRISGPCLLPCIFLWRGMPVRNISSPPPPERHPIAQRARASPRLCDCLTWCWRCHLNRAGARLSGALAINTTIISGRTALDFALPADLVAYLDELDRFIAREIKPLEAGRRQHPLFRSSPRMGAHRFRQRRAAAA